MRSPADFLGLVAYLTVMYGRLPDRAMLEAAYAEGDDGGPEDGDLEQTGSARPQMWFVNTSAAEPQSAASDTAAA